MADFNLRVSLLIVLSCVSVLTQRAEQLSDILRLRKALGITTELRKNRVVRPVLYENSTIDVTVSVDISNVASIELEDREATIEGRVCIYWNAVTLKWDAANFNGLDSLTLRRYEIWVPDIEVFNRVNFDVPNAGLRSPIRLFSNGTLSFCEFKAISVSCDTDMYAFPVDKHQCSVLFGSSTYDLEKLNMIPFLVRDYEKLVARFSKWHLRAVDFHLVQGTSADYFDYTLRLDLIIERKFSFHIYRFVIPMLIGCSLAALFCWLPLGVKQKFILPILGLLIVMLTTSQYFSMLSSSTTVPLFLRFAADLMCFMAFMILLAIVVMVLEDSETHIELPSHPFLDRFLRSKTVSSYILSDEGLLAGPDDQPDNNGGQSAAEVPEIESAEVHRRNWPRLITVLQRVLSVVFLTLYLVVYYVTIGRLE